MDIKNDLWIVPERISLKDREILFLTLEAAGFEIWPDTRNHEGREKYPYVMMSDFVSSVSACKEPKYREHRQISYKELIEELHKIIKDEH